MEIKYFGFVVVAFQFFNEAKHDKPLREVWSWYFRSKILKIAGKIGSKISNRTFDIWVNNQVIYKFS